jgi:glycolate oxidase iron-sulfur subunit
MGARGRVLQYLGLLDGTLEPSEVLTERLMSCLLCGMCEGTCPVGVPIVDAMYRARASLRETDSRRRTLRRALGFVLAHPRLSFRLAGLMRPLLPRLLERVAVPFEIEIPAEPLRTGLKLYRPSGRTRGRVAVFTGCAVNYLMPHLGEALIRVLLRADYEVVLPGGEVCCGAPLRAAGLQEDAARAARRNVQAFSKLQAEAVLSLCPTCTLALRKQYADMVGEGLPKAMDAVPFLLERVELPTAFGGQTAAYHDPCHLRHGLGVKREPREMLGRLGFDVVEARREGCCGLSLSLTHPHLSERLLRECMETYSKAPLVVTACPGCMAQLARSHQKVMHIIEAVDTALERADEDRHAQPAASVEA